MLVRCGRCRAELEVAGSGEFLCPRCGTRNVVRQPVQDPYGIPDLKPPATPPPGPVAEEANTAIRWLVCPQCTYRFAAGVDLERVSCPNCRELLETGEPEPRAGAAS